MLDGAEFHYTSLWSFLLLFRQLIICTTYRKSHSCAVLGSEEGGKAHWFVHKYTGVTAVRGSWGMLSWMLSGREGKRTSLGMLKFVSQPRSLLPRAPKAFDVVVC